jgi:hypothetical protein
VLLWALEGSNAFEMCALSGIMWVIGIWPIALVDFSFGPNLVRENKKLVPVSHKMSVTIDSNWDWRPLLDEFLGTLDWIVYGALSCAQIQQEHTVLLVGVLINLI